MKTINLILFFSFILLTGTTAQVHPLLEEDKHWVFLTHQKNDIGVNILSGFIVSITGDTIVSGENYKKLYSHNLKGEHNCQYPPCFTPNFPYEIESGTLYALLREDVQNGIVYHFNPFDSNCSEEYELFNFQQVVGDTLDMCVRERIKFEEEDGLVDSLSTIEVYNANRKVIHTKGDGVFEGLQFSDELKITEGIGFDLYGFFGGTQDRLIEVCFGTLSECNITTSIKNVPTASKVNLYPNPVNDQLNIASAIDIVRLMIRDSNGRIMYSGNEENLNVGFLNPGIFYVDVILKNNEFIKAKFAKVN